MRRRGVCAALSWHGARVRPFGLRSASSLARLARPARRCRGLNRYRLRLIDSVGGSSSRGSRRALGRGCAGAGSTARNALEQPLAVLRLRRWRRRSGRVATRRPRRFALGRGFARRRACRQALVAAAGASFGISMAVWRSFAAIALGSGAAARRGGFNFRRRARQRVNCRNRVAAVGWRRSQNGDRTAPRAQTPAGCLP